MKNYLALAVFTVLPFWSFAQSTQFQYSYDAAGNRTERNRIVLQVGQPEGNQAAHSTDHESAKTQREQGLQKDGIHLYPNPTEGMVHLEFAEAQTKIDRVRIVEQSGKLMYRAKNLQGPQEFDFSGFSKGLYFIILHRGEDVERFKVVKR